MLAANRVIHLYILYPGFILKIVMFTHVRCASLSLRNEAQLLLAVVIRIPYGQPTGSNFKFTSSQP